MKLREGEAWMPADEFGRSLKGVGFNLLVEDVARAVEFQTRVLGVVVVYQDPDFALVSGYGSQWLFHADHTYRDHPLHGIATAAEGRGAGIELRLYDADPDQVEDRARQGGYVVLEGSSDKPHGLRECFILDDDGYLWVPSKAIGATA